MKCAPAMLTAIDAILNVDLLSVKLLMLHYEALQLENIIINKWIWIINVNINLMQSCYINLDIFI